MTDKREIAEQALTEFASQVEKLGGRYSAMACISCEDWDAPLTKGVATGDPLTVLRILGSILQSIRTRYGWGKREMDVFMSELRGLLDAQLS